MAKIQSNDRFGINGKTYPGGKPKANSAYLRLSEALALHQAVGSPSGARSCFFIDFDGQLTGVSAPEATVGNDDGAYYTLQGVRVDHPAKGLYVKNGRKVYVR